MSPQVAFGAVDAQLGDLEALINRTIAEVELELEIILLQHFTTASKLADEQLDALQRPTAALLAEYDEVLAELGELTGDVDAAAASPALADLQAAPRRDEQVQRCSAAPHCGLGSAVAESHPLTLPLPPPLSLSRARLAPDHPGR